MFRMLPTMNLEQRVALCWSCLWRQLLFTLPLSALCLGLSLIWGFMHAQWVYPSLVAMLEAFCVLGSICFLIGVPCVGYAVRRAFIVQKMPVPDKPRFWQVVMVGLTTMGWSFCASTPISLAIFWISGITNVLLCQLVGLAVQAVAAFYIVLPRQARRLRLQSGAQS